MSEESSKKTALFLAKVTVSVLAAALLLSRLDPGSSFGFLAGSRKTLWFGALFALIVSQIISTRRWQVLMEPLGFTFSWFHVFKIYFTGMFFSLFLPTVVGGDAVKTYYIAENLKRAPAAFYTTLADRVIGMAGQQVFTITGLVLVWGYLPFWLSAGLGGFVLVFYLLLVFFPLLAVPVLHSVKKLRELPRERFFVYWKRPQVVAKALALSLAIHACVVISHMLMGASLGLSVPLSAWLVIYPVSAMAATIPLSLNGIGFREAAYVYMLGFFGISKEEAFALAVMWFSIVLVNGALGGIPYVFGGRLRPGVLREDPS